MVRYARWAMALGLFPLAACNQNPSMPFAATVPSPQSAPTLSAQDQSFLQQAATSDMFEVQSSQMALQRSRNARTRAYAREMIDAHGQTTAKVGDLAQRNGVTLPTGLGPEQERAMAAIGNTRRIFDSEYFRQQALAHQTAIEVYQTEINNGYNTEIKQYAQQTLPELQSHLQGAQGGREMPMGATPARR